MKTVPTRVSARAYIDSLEDPTQRRDCRTLMKIMHKVTGKPAKMWGDSIVGYGNYHYRYASGREGDFFLTGFAPRKQNLPVYIVSGFDAHKKQLAQLGKHKIGKSCLYIKRLDDIDLDVLTDIIEDSVGEMLRRYPTS